MVFKIKSFFEECVKSRQRPNQLRRVWPIFDLYINPAYFFANKLAGFIGIFRKLQLVSRKSSNVSFMARIATSEHIGSWLCQKWQI